MAKGNSVFVSPPETGCRTMLTYREHPVNISGQMNDEWIKEWGKLASPIWIWIAGQEATELDMEQQTGSK